MNSNSISAPPSVERRKRLVRKRTLRRGCSYEPFNQTHLAYVWAAYKRGFFPDMDKSMSPADFQEKLTAWIASVIQSGGDFYVLKGKTRLGEIPVGLVSLAVATPPGARVQYQPHVDWLPEASPRNKLECSLRFLNDLKKNGKMLLVGREIYWHWFDHLCNYGVIRAVGKLRAYYADGTDAILYEGREHVRN